MSKNKKCCCYNYPMFSNPMMGASPYGLGAAPAVAPAPAPRLGGCLCNFPTLVILILIILQFGGCGFFGGNRDFCDDDDRGHCNNGGFLGNGILFIIALFFLACNFGCCGNAEHY
jgi:hypothetical protein